MPSSEGDAPVLTDILVPVPAQEEDQEEEEDEEVEEEKPIKEEDKDTELDYNSDDTVTILRAEYV